MRFAAVVLFAALTAGCNGSTEAFVDRAPQTAQMAFEAHNQIWLMAPDGGGRRALTPRSLEAAMPAWSSDGETIAFAGAPWPKPMHEHRRAFVYLMSANGSDLRRISSAESQMFGISWSPDGDQVAVAEFSGEGTETVSSDIALFDVQSGERTVIDRSSGDSELDVLPAWSPDGSTILFTRARLPSDTELWEMNPDGSDAHMLTGSAGNGAWSPDGGKIAYVSDKDRNGETCYDECNTNGELYIMDADGSHQTRLTRTDTISESAPTWSPDGARIAYFRDAGERGSFIVTVGADGSCPVRITASGGEDRFPAWQPGADRLPQPAGMCAADGSEALSPRAGGPTASVGLVGSFTGYPLYAVGDEFEGRPLTAVDRELSPASAPIPTDSTTFIYASCDVQRSGTGCSDEVQVQIWPACLRNLSLYGGPGPAGLAHRRGVPIRLGPFEVYTGDVTIVIFANRETAYRVVDALEPVNKLAIDAGAGLGKNLPPPVPGALAGKLRCA
jgi:Tol biopolymer transport system component